MRLKLASALIAALLVFGMVFGVGQATAASLPGEPLYGLKLAAEEARMGLTSDPEAQADLAIEFAENRLDEIGKMMAAGRDVDRVTAQQAQQGLSQAFQYARQVGGQAQLEVQYRLGNMLQSQHRVMSEEVKGVPQQAPVQTLLRSMENLRQRAELHTGGGYPDIGEQNRNRVGGTEDPAPPDPGDQSGNGVQSGQQDDVLLDAAGETDQSGQSQGSTGSGAQGSGQGQGAQPEPIEPNQNDDAQHGPGPQLMGTPEGAPYEGEGEPSWGPGPDNTQQGTDAPAGFKWLWKILGKDSQSGSGTSGSGTSGSGTSGSGTSGSGTSGSGTSGSGTSGNGTPGGKP